MLEYCNLIWDIPICVLDLKYTFLFIDSHTQQRYSLKLQF